MKGAKLFAGLLLAVLVLASCASAPSGAPAAAGVPGAARILPVTHIDGFGTPTDELAWIAWEFEAQTYVRYQIVYISCTCRQESVNKQSMLFLEIAKGSTGGRIHRIFFDFWGDSQVMPEGYTRAQIEEGYVPKFVNVKSADIDPIDTIAGATVTTVNLKQITKAVLAYHDAKYSAATEAPLYVDATSSATSEGW
ncbi:MAG TPA: hypothetical protein PKW82_06775 [Spirochaetales bacterium]|nr:hypothetical protein [Spirochaetales bacterium]